MDKEILCISKLGLRYHGKDSVELFLSYLVLNCEYMSFVCTNRKLSCRRGRSTLRVVAYFANSFKITQDHLK